MFLKAFPNASTEPRASMIFGFHRRASVLGKRLVHRNSRMTHNEEDSILREQVRIYDEDYIQERSRMIQLAIDARRQKYPEEVSYKYQPFVGREGDEECRWTPQLKEDGYGAYWNRDISI